MQRARIGERVRRLRGPSPLPISPALFSPAPFSPAPIAAALFSVALISLAIGLPSFAAEDAPVAEAQNSCIECHSNPDFLVTAKKLYDYYKDWEMSIHHQEGVGCEDCHGGDPKARDKKSAHGTEVSGGLTAGSTVNFANIPATCGNCHADIYEGFRQSNHFAHLLKKKQEKQGPNCVTCHGSMNTTVLNVNTVKQACERCHNEKTGNHPEIPDKANDILNRFLSIQRYYRYIGIRGEPAETQAFFAVMDERVRDLSVLWHTFDLPKIDKETRFVLELLKTKRAEVRNHPRTESP